MFNKYYFLKCPFTDNVEKYGTARQVTDNNTIRCTRFACWI